MIHLAEFPAVWAQIYAEIDECQGKMSPELERRLDDLIQGSEQKLDQAAYVACGAEAEANVLREEISRLGARAKALDIKADRIRAGIKGGVAAMGGKVKTLHFTMSVSAGRTSIGLIDGIKPEDLPVSFTRIKTELDKDQAKALFEKDPESAKLFGLIQIKGDSILRIK